MPPRYRAPTRGAFQPAGAFLQTTTKTNRKGGQHGNGHGQMFANRTRDSHRYPDLSRELWAPRGVFLAHPLSDLPHRPRVVCAGSLGRRAGHPDRAVVAAAPESTPTANGFVGP